MPLPPPFAFPPMPVPPAGFAGLTPEELRALEGHERQHLEARLQSLRNIHTLLDAAMLQINQYLTVLASLGPPQPAASVPPAEEPAPTAVPAAASTSTPSTEAATSPPGASLGLGPTVVQAQTHARSLEGAGQCLLGDEGDGAWGEQQGRAPTPGTHPRDVWLSLRHGEGQKDVTYPSWGVDRNSVLAGLHPGPHKGTALILSGTAQCRCDAHTKGSGGDHCSAP